METNKDLSSFNTFGLPVIASKYIEVHSEEDLINAVKEGQIDQDSTLVLGGGSNILFTQDFNGLVLKVNILGFETISSSNEKVRVRIGAGEVWHQTVLKCIDKGWGGIENLSLIPGLVGAAPIQNIGAYGVEIKDVFHSLDWIDLRTGEKRTFDMEACEFGYRNSVFKNELKGKGVVTSITLDLSLSHDIKTSYGAIKAILEERNISEPGIRDISEAVVHIRQSKLPDPAVIGNGGSFFKNPVLSKEDFEELKGEYPEIPSYPDANGVKVPAGWLIEQAGWKGLRRGSIGVHEKQALVLVNYGSGAGADIHALALDIVQSIKEKYGIHLEAEVNII